MKTDVTKDLLSARRKAGDWNKGRVDSILEKLKKAFPQAAKIEGFEDEDSKWIEFGIEEVEWIAWIAADMPFMFINSSHRHIFEGLYLFDIVLFEVESADESVFTIDEYSIEAIFPDALAPESLKEGLRGAFTIKEFVSLTKHR